MTDVILRISGMDCGACAVRIVRALRGLPGVHAVFVSDTAGCARLTYDEAAVGLPAPPHGHSISGLTRHAA